MNRKPHKCLHSTVPPVISILKFFKSNSITVRKGSAVDIPAEVTGLPLPTLQWMKDNVVMEKPEDETMTMETEEVTVWSFADRGCSLPSQSIKKDLSIRNTFHLLTDLN